MNAVQKFFDCLDFIEESVERYHRSFYNQFPLEEDEPNERAHPGSTRSMDALNALAWRFIRVRSVIRAKGKENIPPVKLAFLEQATLTLDEVIYRFHVEWDIAKHTWRRDPSNSLASHFQNMYGFCTALSSTLLTIENGL